jgi:hypothetical protein
MLGGDVVLASCSLRAWIILSAAVAQWMGSQWLNSLLASTNRGKAHVIGVG